MLATVLYRSLGKTAFSMDYVACKECARVFALPVQSLLGFSAPGARPSIYGRYWGTLGRTREVRACDHIM